MRCGRAADLSGYFPGFILLLFHNASYFLTLDASRQTIPTPSRHQFGPMEYFIFSRKDHQGTVIDSRAAYTVDQRWHDDLGYQYDETPQTC
jgi:hypothetical protein